MNILFLTLLEFETLQEGNLYTDLLSEFVEHDHEVFVISPVARREKKPTHIVKEKNATIIRLKIGNTQKTNIIEKGISTLLIEPMYKAAIKKYFKDIKFDLVLYSTPPITLTSAVEYVKNRDGAKTYLLLKDIFPQNAVDIGIMSTAGVKGLLYRHFRKQEKRLYAISDHIGCMSQANVDYLLQHNPEVEKEKVEVCPNSAKAIDKSVNEDERKEIRRKYEIPLYKRVFVYGGNLGKPQGIPFFIECLEACKDIKDVFFLIIGSGTEYGLLDDYVKNSKHENIKLVAQLPVGEYDKLVASSDVGLIFLDHRFTIPNFPSRLLGYMQAKLPVLACTDPSTDIGKVIEENGFGWWCESNSTSEFTRIIEENDDKVCLNKMGTEAFRYLNNYYSVTLSYQTLLNRTNRAK